MCCSHFYRLTDEATQVFAAMSAIPASEPPQIQECVLPAARYPAAEQARAAGGEMLTPLALQPLALASLLQETA